MPPGTAARMAAATLNTFRHRVLPLGIHARAHPIEVTLVARDDGQHDEFRRVVRVFGNDEFLERLEFRLRRLENDQHLRARFHFSLPPIVRFDFGNQIGAGDEAGFQGGFRKDAGGYQLGSSDQHSYHPTSDGCTVRGHAKSAHADGPACLSPSGTELPTYDASEPV